jgi:hypothetical protein
VAGEADSSDQAPAGRNVGTLAFAMRALGRDEPPVRLRVNETIYTRTTVVKHDFFAATAFYDSPAGKAVLKTGRLAPFCGLPLTWLGRFLCERELGFYRKLRDLPAVPAVVATFGKTGFLHAYVQGRPLDQQRRVPDSFFPELRELLAELRRRGIAYVDTNKPQNILLGDDGRPHLIDFQISYDATPLGWPGRLLLRLLADADEYHVLKHVRRFRRDQLSGLDRRRLERKAWYIRLHRAFTRPYFIVRRALMGRLRREGVLLPEGSK